MTDEDRISREFRTNPTSEQHALMHALSEWLNSETESGKSWDVGEALVGAMTRAARFGDSTCDGADGTLVGGHDPEVVNYPVALRMDGNMWEASYVCRECGHHYRCWWGD